MTTLGGLLALGCLAVGGFHLLRLVLPRTDPMDEAAHAAMGAGMAAMFSPVGDPVPAPVWIVVFLLCGAWFASVALRVAVLGVAVSGVAVSGATVSGAPAGRRRDDAVHHVVGSVAMLVMLLGAHGGGVAGTGAVHEGHVGHGGGPEGTFGVAPVAALLLAGYFAWHVLRCTDRLRDAPAAPAGAVATRTAVLRDARTVVAAHVVMAAAMAVMLLGMV